LDATTTRRSDEEVQRVAGRRPSVKKRDLEVDDRMCTVERGEESADGKKRVGRGVVGPGERDEMK